MALFEQKKGLSIDKPFFLAINYKCNVLLLQKTHQKLIKLNYNVLALYHRHEHATYSSVFA